MRITIDFSVLTREPAAFGRVSGPLELPVTPMIGDSVSFLFPTRSKVSPVEGFVGQIKIEHRILIPDQKEPELLIMLEDVTMPTLAHAEALADYLERGFDLYVERYEPL